MVFVEVTLSYAEKVDPYEEDHSDSHDCHPSLHYERTVLAYCIMLRLAECPEDEQTEDGDEEE